MTSTLTYGKFCERADFERKADPHLWDKRLAPRGPKRYLCPVENTFAFILRDNATHRVAREGTTRFNLLTSQNRERAVSFIKTHLLSISFAQQ